MGIIKDIWIKNQYIGRLKKVFYIMLKYHFNYRSWHISPINEREYAIWIVDEINSKQNINTVVEIGCGIGEIIGNIKSCYKVGFDIQKEAINAAKIIHPFSNFLVGGFYSVVNMNIDFLIIVNFTHGIEPTVLKRSLEILLKKNNVRNIVMDVTNGYGYRYHHQLREILGEEYDRKKKSKIFYYGKKAKRWVEIYERKS